MTALNATRTRTGRTKNQAFWLAILFMAGRSRHHPAIAVDSGLLRIEAEVRGALGNGGAFVDQQLDDVIAAAPVDDAVAPGIAYLHHIHGEAVLGKGDELRPDADLQDAARIANGGAIGGFDRLAGDRRMAVVEAAGEDVHARRAD